VSLCRYLIVHIGMAARTCVCCVSVCRTSRLGYNCAIVVSG
jgi:hypothetical protein